MERKLNFRNPNRVPPAPDAPSAEAAAPPLPDPGSRPGDGTHTFTYTGALQTYVVPAGVTAVQVKLWGASGGSTGLLSGGGALVAHRALPVTPGERLGVLVGGRGDLNVGLCRGGFGGGGNGANNPTYAWAGGGGGRSAVMRGDVDIISAGGGGGTGYPTVSGGGGHGGAGPGGTGGTDPVQGSGRGGTATAGGAPGTGETVGNPGQALLGAHAPSGPWLAAGGGGGGMFGGGSGGHTIHVTSGGGGGGSCLLPAGARVEAVQGETPAGSRDPDWDGSAGAPVRAAGHGNHGRVVIRPAAPESAG